LLDPSKLLCIIPAKLLLLLLLLFANVHLLLPCCLPPILFLCHRLHPSLLSLSLLISTAYPCSQLLHITVKAHLVVGAVKALFPRLQAWLEWRLVTPAVICRRGSCCCEYVSSTSAYLDTS
jgi:hypothetical protein